MTMQLAVVPDTIQDLPNSVQENILTQMEFFGHFARLSQFQSAKDNATAVPRQVRTNLNKAIKEAEEKVKTLNRQKDIKEARNEWVDLLSQKGALTEKVNELAEPFKAPMTTKVNAMKSCLVDMLTQVQDITGVPIEALEGIPEERQTKMVAIAAAKSTSRRQLTSIII